MANDEPVHSPQDPQEDQAQDPAEDSEEDSQSGSLATPEDQIDRPRFGNWIPRPARPSEQEESTRLLHAMLSKEGDTKRAHNALRATIEADGLDDEGGVEERERVEEKDDLGSIWFGAKLRPDPSFLQRWQERQGLPGPDPLMALFDMYVQTDGHIPVSAPEDQFVILGAERRRASRIMAASMVRQHCVFDFHEKINEFEMTLIYVHNVVVLDRDTGTQTTWLVIATGSTELPEIQLIAIPSTYISRICTTLDTEAQLKRSVTVDGILHQAPGQGGGGGAHNSTQTRQVVRTATTHLELTQRFVPRTQPHLNAPQMWRWRAFCAQCALGDLSVSITGEKCELDPDDEEEHLETVFDADGRPVRVEGVSVWEAVRGREAASGSGPGAAAEAATAALEGRGQWLDARPGGPMAPFPAEWDPAAQYGSAEIEQGYGPRFGNYYAPVQQVPPGTGFGPGRGQAHGHGYGQGQPSGYGYASHHRPGFDFGHGHGRGRGGGQDRGRGRVRASGSGLGFNVTARRAMERRQ